MYRPYDQIAAFSDLCLSAVLAVYAGKVRLGPRR